MFTGAPGSGKGTQCEKLVEEFGYQHISTGDLMRIEAKKGTREGDRIKQIMDQGKLIPTELICQVLIDAMLANPSQVSFKIQISPKFESRFTFVRNTLFFDLI